MPTGDTPIRFICSKAAHVRVNWRIPVDRLRTQDYSIVSPTYPVLWLIKNNSNNQPVNLIDFQEENLFPFQQLIMGDNSSKQKHNYSALYMIQSTYKLNNASREDKFLNILEYKPRELITTHVNNIGAKFTACLDIGANYL